MRDSVLPPPRPQPAQPHAALELRGLAKRHTIPIIEDVTLRVATGEFVCLLGPNGCGKTTLLRVLAGLETADQGSVLIAGRPLDRPGPRPDRIGVVFQEPRLLPWRSVRDNVALGLKPLGVRRREARARADRYLDLVGLRGFEGYFPGRLSGGMQQRAAIARALATEPTILLLDEPFSALDPETRRIMQDELAALWSATGITILFVTHSIDEAQRLGTRIVLLSARPARVRADSQGEAGGLSAAQLLALLSAEVQRQRGLGAQEVRGD